MAVVWTPPASLPAAASVRPKAASRSPAAMAGRYFCFCSSEPNWRIAEAPKALAAKLIATALQPRLSSSVTMQSSSAP